jgi:threonyl-tRNA synthetase
LRKVPYMLVVGDNEADADAVAARRHKEGDLGTMSLADFAGRAAGEIEARA